MPVNVIGTLKPKNNGKFPVAEAVDIKVTDDLRLDKALEKKADLSSVNFALSGKADNSDINSLQSQINEIIIPVTQDAEVQNARVGADGTSYETLKSRLDSEYNSLNNDISDINNEVLPYTQKELNEINSDLDYIFSARSISYIGFVLGNSASSSSETNPSRITVDGLISIPANTTLKSIGNYEFSLYNASKAIITSGWVTEYTTATNTTYYLVVRKSDDSDLSEIYSSLKIYDCVSSSELIGASVTRDTNYVLKPYEVTKWYRTRMRFDPMAVESTTTRLCNITTYNHENDLNPGDKIEIELVDDVNYKYAFSLFSGTTRVQDYWAYRHEPITVTVNQPCYLGIMLCHDDDTENIALSEAVNIKVKITPASYNTSKWSGKSAVFVGDSITYGVNTQTGSRYWEFLAQKCGFSAVGMGVGGSCWSITSDYGSQNSPIASRWETIPDKDLICIFAGTNDYGHSTPMGTINDSTDISFYGALNVVIEGLVNKYPYRRICLMTPLHRYGFGGLTYDTEPNSEGHKLEDYVNAIKEVGKKYGVPVIDTFSISGMNPLVASIRTNLVTDGLHPNAKGHELIADRVYQLINSL